MYQTVIIEDDPMVASINKQYVELTTSFQVSGSFKNGAKALEYLKSNEADLIILDYYTPLMNGAEFIDRLHAMGKTPAIIMVTSANDTEIVGGLLSRGVIDYLVKPFEYSRFKAALDKFQKIQSILEGAKLNIKQSEIDLLLNPPEEVLPTSGLLAKGLNEATLGLVRGFLAENAGTLFTSEQVAEQVHLSRITIRRYLNYMVDTGELVSTIDYHTGGRPSIKYQLPR